jgi:hypothetical protein
VWGPTQLSRFGIPYSLMFVAKNTKTEEYFVVIRGTNFESLSSWIEQDFAVGSAQPFSKLPGSPPNIPADALISQGTFNGMTDLISLTDPTTSQPLVEFLEQQQPKYLYVTGHSLGGTLTPPLFTYLNAMLYGGGPVTNMALWSFAGLTSGGTGFNNYFNSILPNDQSFLWRLHNSLDIAPFCWVSKAGIESIYNFSPYYLQWGDIERIPINALFDAAHNTGISYAHPQIGQELPGKFETNSFDDNFWGLQAVHQHHPTTYQKLVNEMYSL